MIDALYDQTPVRMPGFAQDDQAVHARIRAEYKEMPGMRLTLSQAAHLFDLELTHCACTRHARDRRLLWTNGREFLGHNVGRRFA